VQYWRSENSIVIFYEKQSRKISAIKLQGNSIANMVWGIKVYLEIGATLTV
jgi:hypothetical protein